MFHGVSALMVPSLADSTSNLETSLGHSRLYGGYFIFKSNNHEAKRAKHLSSYLSHQVADELSILSGTF